MKHSDRTSPQLKSLLHTDEPDRYRARQITLSAPKYDIGPPEGSRDVPEARKGALEAPDRAREADWPDRRKRKLFGQERGKKRPEVEEERREAGDEAYGDGRRERR